jgi:ADP-ribosylglycohydrolase
MHDPIVSIDFVTDELHQRQEAGYDVAEAVAALEVVDPGDLEAVGKVLALLETAPRLAGWDYEEPSDLDGILDSLPQSDDVGFDKTLLSDKILGAWLGRIAGCNLGKPLEFGEHWTKDHIKRYLELADAYPLRDYVPVLDPMPEEFELRENWVETTRGRVDGSARDDDIDYPILGLHLLEQHGANLETRHVADAWLRLFPFHQVYTAERAAYANLVAGLPLQDVARHRNPYREWIGALIRGDAFGWVNPGRPKDAVRLAYRDASLSHVANGIYGELWSAALVSCAFGASSAAEAVEASLAFVPLRSRLRGALEDVWSMYRRGLTWDDAVAQIQSTYGHYHWVHTINNAAIIAAGLLWGADDYAATVGLTVQGGWDTDSNGATAGSVCGTILGAAALPPHFIEPLHDRTRSALFGFDNSRISDLADRTLRLATDGLS